LAHALTRAREVNPVTRFDAIGLNLTGESKGIGGIIFAGTATADGTLQLTLGSRNAEPYVLSVSAGDTAATIVTALAAAVTASPSEFIDASPSGSAVLLTATVRGTWSQSIGVNLTGTVPGITFTVNQFGATVAGTDGSLTGVLDVIGADRYQGIVWMFEDPTDVVSVLDARFNVTNDIQDGRLFYGKIDTLANHLTALASLNSSSVCACVDRRAGTANYAGPTVFEPAHLKVAEFAAIRALRRTDGALLGNTVIARSAGDAFGGPHTNSKPYFNTPLANAGLPFVGTSWDQTEVAQLEAAGGFVMDANRAQNTVITGDVVTTYKTDAAGNPDTTWKYLNYVDTATACREYLINNTRAQYPQYRGTAGALIPGVDSANEASVAAFIMRKISELGDLGLLMKGVGTQDGETVDYDKRHREALTVSFNVSAGTFTVGATLYPVTQFRAANFSFSIAFDA
jgi:hypothetical protein